MFCFRVSFCLVLMLSSRSSSIAAHFAYCFLLVTDFSMAVAVSNGVSLWDRLAARCLTGLFFNVWPVCCHIVVFDGFCLSQRMTKPTKLHVRPAKTQISLGIRPVWSECSLSAWRKLESLATHWAQVKTLIRLGGCQGWSESSLGPHAFLLIL